MKLKLSNLFSRQERQSFGGAYPKGNSVVPTTTKTLEFVLRPQEAVLGPYLISKFETKTGNAKVHKNVL